MKDQYDELADQRKDTLLKYPSKYVHKMVVEYDINKVNNFIKSWKEEIDKRDTIIENFDDTLKQATDGAIAEFENSLEEIKKGIEEDMSKEPEELKEELYKARMAQIKEQQNFIEEADKRKEALRKQVEEKLKPMLKEHEQKRKIKAEAIKFWENPKTKQ